MKLPVTAAPGQTPAANITNREDYKLDVSLRKHSNEQYVLKIKKFIPELGWREFFFMVSPEELDKIQMVLDVGATIGKNNAK
jgi:DNA replication protein DnaD